MIRVAGPSATVAFDGREREVTFIPRLPGGPAVAGDRVRVLLEGETGVIREVLPRTSLISRGEFANRNRSRPLVANADLLIVVAAANDPPFRPRFIDRYLVAGELGGLAGAIAITKMDLDEHDHELIDRATSVYRDIGYPVIAGDTADPAYIEEVRGLIDGRIAALCGHSGVGKSSLAGALTGVHRAVGEVSERAGTGRHTTTDPRLIPLPGRGAVIDTAGVRNFYLPPITPEELAQGFPEIAAVADRCRFTGCRHSGDAGCVVPDHVSAGRLDSYRRLLATLEDNSLR